MARRSKTGQASQQGPPTQFRLGNEYCSRLDELSRLHEVEPCAVAKALVIMSLVTLDCRYLGLVIEAAKMCKVGTVSRNAAHVCAHVGSALSTAALLGKPLPFDGDERTRFVVRAVCDYAKHHGTSLDEARLLASLRSPAQEAT